MNTRDPLVSLALLRRYRIEAIAGAAAIAVVVTGGLLIAGPAHGLALAPDSAWATAMRADRTAGGVTVASALAVVGGTLVTSVLTVVLAGILLAFRRWRLAVGLVATVALASGASSSLKVLIARPRPAGGIAHLSTYSYPSGHSTTAAALVAVLGLAVPRVWSWTLGAAWVLLIAWSRTYLGVHWLSDVAAGAVLGAAVALLVDGVLHLVSRGKYSADARTRPGPRASGAH